MFLKNVLESSLLAPGDGTNCSREAHLTAQMAELDCSAWRTSMAGRASVVQVVAHVLGCMLWSGLTVLRRTCCPKPRTRVESTETEQGMAQEKANLGGLRKGVTSGHT